MHTFYNVKVEVRNSDPGALVIHMSNSSNGYFIPENVEVVEWAKSVVVKMSGA